jgi:hypothetical protein
VLGTYSSYISPTYMDHDTNEDRRAGLSSAHSAFYHDKAQELLYSKPSHNNRYIQYSYNEVISVSRRYVEIETLYQLSNSVIIH